MSDIKAAAERFKLAEEIGDHTVYDGDEERADVDAYALAREHMKFRDSTPLKDRAYDQWRELGFEWEEGIGHDENWNITVGGVFIRYFVDKDIVAVVGTNRSVNDVELGQMTLGQLRHLIAALGGPVEKT